MKLSRLVNKGNGKTVNQFYGRHKVHQLGPTTLALNDMFYFDTEGELISYNISIDVFINRSMSELYNL